MRRVFRFFLLAFLPMLAACSSNNSGNQEQVQTGQIEVRYTLACNGNTAVPSVTFMASGQGYQQQQSTLSNADLTGAVTFNNVPVDTPITLISSTSLTCPNGDVYGYVLSPASVTVSQLGETVKVKATPVLQAAKLTIQDGGV